MRAFDRVTRVAGAAVLVLIIGFLLLPPLFVGVLSFANQEHFGFPPESWGFRQYVEIGESPAWGRAVLYSIALAVPVAILSVLIVVPAVLAIERSKLPGRRGIQAAGMSSLIIPIVAYAVAMYGVYAEVGLLGSYLGLVLANTILAIPFVLVTAGAALSQIPPDLELAAMTFGASRFRAWWQITLPLLLPAIFAGSLLAFVTSFDEAVFINFLGGAGQVTLPKAIFDSVRIGVDPVITAISTIFMVATSALMYLVARLRRR